MMKSNASTTEMNFGIQLNKKMTTLYTLLVLLVMTSFGTSATAQKVAYVDVESIVPEMPAYKKAKSEVEAYGKQLSKVLEEKQVKMQAYYQEVNTLVQEGKMPPKGQQEAEAKLQQMQAELQKEAGEADQKLLAKEQELTKPMYEEFNQAIAKVAKDNGFGYVMDKKMMLYSAGGVDVTEKVKTALGISW